MRKLAVAASALLVLLVITGCRRRRAAVSPPPPPPPPVRQPAAVPHATLAGLPAIPSPAPPEVVLGGPVERAPSRLEPRKHRTPQTGQKSGVNASRSQAAGEEPPATTPIGQLSAAPNTQSLPSSTSIGNEIRWIQQQLKKVHQELSPKQQHTAAQIRTFLAKAANALQAGDLDGAHTLTVKARVLLGEIE